MNFNTFWLFVDFGNDLLNSAVLCNQGHPGVNGKGKSKICRLTTTSVKLHDCMFVKKKNQGNYWLQ